MLDWTLRGCGGILPKLGGGGPPGCLCSEITAVGSNSVVFFSASLFFSGSIGEDLEQRTKDLETYIVVLGMVSLVTAAQLRFAAGLRQGMRASCLLNKHRPGTQIHVPDLDFLRSAYQARSAVMVAWSVHVRLAMGE